MFNFLAGDFLKELGLKISDFLNSYLDMATGFIKSMSWWAEALILLAIVVFLIIGILRFVVKSWKFLIVVAVLGAIAFVVFYFFINKNNASTIILRNLSYFIRL